MEHQEENYNKIMQFLKSRDEHNIELGIQLLKGSEDTELMIRFLSDKSYIAYTVIIPLAVLFKEKPALWQAVKNKIPTSKQNRIATWLKRTILAFKSPSISYFCLLATQQAQKKWKNFPAMTPAILTEHSSSGYGSDATGKQLDADGVGWSFSMMGEYIGPGDTCYTEEWIAIAHHPEHNIHIEYDYTNKIIWTEDVLHKPK